MATISAKDVMSLRQRTGLGMMECKKALTETEGDFDAAVDLLRQQLKGKMDERADREAAEGAVATAVKDGAAAIVQLQSETDFAAKNESFLEAAKKIAEMALDAPDGEVSANEAMNELIDNLRITIKENISLARGHKLSGEKAGAYVHHNYQIGVVLAGSGDLSDELFTGICQHIAAATPTPMAIDESGLPAEELEKHRAAAVEEAQASGKPPEIAEKIAAGKLKKWIDEHTLLGQIYLREMDQKKPVRDYLPKGAALEQFVRYRLGE